MRPIKTPDVAAAFDAYPDDVRPNMLALRELIFDTAAETEGVGDLEETLKWGEPSYLTNQTKSGSTVRIDWKKKAPDHYAMYFNCNTTLVESFREWFPTELSFEGNRAIVFKCGDNIATEPLSRCIAAALTYKLRGK